MVELTTRGWTGVGQMGGTRTGIQDGMLGGVVICFGASEKGICIGGCGWGETTRGDCTWPARDAEACAQAADPVTAQMEVALRRVSMYYNIINGRLARDTAAPAPLCLSPDVRPGLLTGPRPSQLTRRLGPSTLPDRDMQTPHETVTARPRAERDATGNSIQRD